MTYVEWAERFVDLVFPVVDPTYSLRFLHLLQRIEARVCGQESGEFTSLFAGVDDVASDPKAAIAKLEAAYPQVAEIHVTPADVAWFPVLVSEYPKPMPFVPVIDNDLLRRWGQDQLWQSEDARYSADSVRVIPGPISVAGITTVDEPVAHILGRFEPRPWSAPANCSPVPPPTPTASSAAPRAPKRSSAPARTSPGSAT